MERLLAKYTDQNSKFIEVDGLNVHYRDEGNGFPLLLIHGSFSSLHTFDAWTSELASNHRVVRLDLPGFGLTGHQKDSRYSMHFYQLFIGEFLKKLGIQQCDIAGSSIGGWIAWEFALTHPVMIRKKILIDSAGFLSKRNAPLPFRMAKTPLINSLLKHAIQKSLIERYLRQVYSDQTKISSELVSRYYDLFNKQGNPQAFIALVNSRCKPSIQHLKDIECPTLILWGQDDAWIPVEHAYRFQSEIPNSEAVIYAGVGHIPMEEIPVKSAKDVKSFLGTKRLVIV